MLSSELLKLATAIKAGTLAAGDFIKLSAAAPGLSLMSIFRSDVINGTATVGTVYDFPGTALGTGKGAVSWFPFFECLSTSGTQTTKPNWKIGTNGAHDNMNTGVNFYGNVVAGKISGLGPVPDFYTVPGPVGELSSNVKAEVVTQGAGAGLAISGRLILGVFLIPFPLA